MHPLWYMRILPLRYMATSSSASERSFPLGFSSGRRGTDRGTFGSFRVDCLRNSSFIMRLGTQLGTKLGEPRRGTARQEWLTSGLFLENIVRNACRREIDKSDNSVWWMRWVINRRKQLGVCVGQKIHLEADWKDLFDARGTL